MPIKLSEHSRMALRLASHEAFRFNHEYVGTEHLLLGLRREEGGAAAALLSERGLDLRTIRLCVEELVLPGSEMTHPPLPLTPRASKALATAADEAKEAASEFVETGHILLALLRDSDCLARQVLESFGLDVEELRGEVVAQMRP